MDRDEVTFPFQFGDKMFVTVFFLFLAYKAELTHPLGTQAAHPSARRPATSGQNVFFYLRLLSSVYRFSTVVTWQQTAVRASVRSGSTPPTPTGSGSYNLKTVGNHRRKTPSFLFSHFFILSETKAV
jgi:hypothetical protein